MILTSIVGNYEYPFEVLLPDDIPDSVEGLPGGGIVYKMKAIVERAGIVNKNVTCRKVMPRRSSF
jgi:arrestin-related trafficking adapter 4/5/7